MVYIDFCNAAVTNLNEFKKTHQKLYYVRPRFLTSIRFYDDNSEYFIMYFQQQGLGRQSPSWIFST